MPVRSFGKVISFRLLQLSNAETPMAVTLCEIVIFFKLVQFLKASCPMLVTPSGIITLVSLFFPENARLAIPVTVSSPGETGGMIIKVSVQKPIPETLQVPSRLEVNSSPCEYLTVFSHFAVRVRFSETVSVSKFHAVLPKYQPRKVSPSIVGSSGWMTRLPRQTVCAGISLPPTVSNVTVKRFSGKMSVGSTSVF